MVRPATILLISLFYVAAADAAPRTKKEEAIARASFEKGTKYFKAEEFEAALPLFLEAYELSNHRPATTLALAQCERMLKRYDDALLHYREYLASTPKPSDSKQVLETVELVEDLK